MCIVQDQPLPLFFILAMQNKISSLDWVHCFIVSSVKKYIYYNQELKGLPVNEIKSFCVHW